MGFFCLLETLNSSKLIHPIYNSNQLESRVESYNYIILPYIISTRG